MLIVEVNVVYLKIAQRFFAAFTHVFRFAGNSHTTLAKVCSKLSTDEYFGAEGGVFQELSEKSLILPLQWSLVLSTE